jgi:hypothetical protein
MDENLARHVVRTSFQVARELRGLLMLLKEHLGKDEYEAYARKIAAAIDGVNVALLETAFSAHPGLKREVDASIEKYDRFL